MNTPARSDRLRQAVAQAAENVALSTRLISERSGRPAPGDLYLIPQKSEAAVEWLVVRSHTDIPGLVFVVPVDEAPWKGMLDLRVDPQPIGRRLFARCGMGLWVSSAYLRDEHRVGLLPLQNLPMIVHKAAEAAAGRVAVRADQHRDDADPEYQDWVRLVEDARGQLQQQADEGGVVVRFSAALSDRPPTLADASSMGPNAGLDDQRLVRLDAAIHDAADRLRHRDSNYAALGHLYLMLEESGVCAVWEATGGPAPALAVRDSAGAFRPVVWRHGADGKLQRAEPVFDWIDNRVVLAVGGDPSAPARTILIQQ